MRRTLALIALVPLALLTACGSDADSNPSSSASASPSAVNLDGTYKQTDGEDGSYQEAVIHGGTITINWVDTQSKTKNLYWVGTVDKGKDSWTSKGDTKKMGESMMASQDQTKDFKVQGGTLSYEASAMGTTKTMELKKQ